MLIACLFSGGCGSSSKANNDTPESLMTEGITLFTQVITDFENGMSAQDAEKKYTAQVTDYNNRCRSISPPEDVQKKLFKEHFKTMMELDKRFAKVGLGQGRVPRVAIGSWKQAE
jgi:hypothetical protein